jgi:hypothetical protein
MDYSKAERGAPLIPLSHFKSQPNSRNNRSMSLLGLLDACNGTDVVPKLQSTTTQ